MRFEFATATQIIFGPGTIREVVPEAAGMGKRAFIITGRSTERAKGLLEQLNKHAIAYVTFSVPTEPTITIVTEAVKQASQTKSDLVIGIGGGSVLDTGKVIAAMLTNSGKLLDYLEVVGQGLQPALNLTLRFQPQQERALRSPVMPSSRFPNIRSRSVCAVP
ncbi:MAG: iron-containing alcohol dehydrogenase [Planctomycetota bacterium]|jgi:alcohol dehydrogenase class IV